MYAQSPPAVFTVGIDCRFIQDKYHGIGRYTYGLLTGLCSIDGGHKVIAFVDPSLPNRRFPLHALDRRDKLEIRHISIPLYKPRELWAWYAILRGSRVDVFHSPYFWAPILLRCPLVITIYDMIFDRYPQYMPHRRFALIYKISSRMALKRSRCVITVSDATRGDILRFTHTQKSKVAVVPAGVDAAFKPVRAEQTRRAVRRRYGLPSSYILALGARRPHKNIDRLGAGFSLIAADVPHSLVLAGTMDERFDDDPAYDSARWKREGRIIEIGHVEEQDLPALYSMADLFVQPSIIEGFGLPVLEAMACGCPVACSNTTSLPEVAGDAAVFFDPLSTREIADTLTHVLSSTDLRQDLVQRGRQRASQFSWERAASSTLEVYRTTALSAHG